MSKLTQEERDKLPEEDFGDPERRLFPIVDQDDVDSAAHLIGKAKDPEAVKGRVMAIAKRKSLKAPEAWEEDKEPARMAEFSLDDAAQEDGDTVIREGLVFRSGEYPDKEFSLTQEELLAAAAEFQPVGVDLEHTPTVLDGKLGRVEKAWASEDGRRLFARVRLPRWLDALLGEGPRKVSCAWDRASKRLAGLSLVRTPRVTDAALMAAFAEAEGKARKPAGMADWYWNMTRQS